MAALKDAQTLARLAHADRLLQVSPSPVRTGPSLQIYVVSAAGGPAKRISFGEDRYSTPVWSPRGDLIAFTRIKNTSFGIGEMKPTARERILVKGFHNEGPTFVPNGFACRSSPTRAARAGRRSI